MSLQWYVLRSKPRKEGALWEYARSKELECFYPRIRVNPVNPRARKVKPYFPGYMFVKADLVETGRSEFRWMPHSLGLVRFGDEPAPVPDSLISGIRHTVAKIAEAGGEKLAGLQPGDEIYIEDGPFSGYRAIFDAQVSGQDRVRVLLQMLNNRREMPLELEVGQIRKESE
ncbi:MAG: transcription termination/antitermination NusG family protein [Chloroflexota bacterium]|nr:transcription termination/antitermination NusG family protein [Chloroflexota bacterium]